MSDITGTQLQSVENDNKTDIYPITDASIVTATKSDGTDTNVEDWLSELTNLISEVTENAIKLNIKISYAQTSYSEVNQVQDNENISWGENFVQPTAELPYTWKKTEIQASSDDDNSASSTSYELASISSETTQTIYTARSADTKAVTISYYNTETDGIVTPYYNDTLDNILAKSENSLWSKTPVSISAVNPNGYIATRARNDNGEWKAFSIVQNAKWAYNSIPKFKYRVTSTATAPTVVENDSDYSKVEGWSDTITGNFTGYLWMIAATVVNDVYQLDGDSVWSSPTLISIIK